MIVTQIAETAAPGPPGRRNKSESRKLRSHDPEDRLHVSALLVGLLDARSCQVDFFDTPGGRELERWYRRHHPGRRHGGH
jgi:hypothetical protein